MLQELSKNFNLENMRGEERDHHHLRAPLVVKKGEEGATSIEEGGTLHYHKDNHLPSKSQSSRERMIQTSTLTESKK